MFTQLKNKLTLTSSFKTAPNIGLIKYWGKWNEKELIPLNDNVGVTLNSQDVFTTTKVILNPESETNQLIINGSDFPISDRIQRMFSIFKEHIKCKVPSNAYKNSPSDKLLGDVLPNIEKYGIIVESTNSFPTGSGLASSSSGLSALALCLTDLLKVNTPDVRYISRIGSGSACRCLYGNLVLFPGVSLDNLDQPNNEQIIQSESKRCLPTELSNSSWLKQETKILILTDTIKGQKDVLSRDGMRQTWMTSQLIQHRVRVGVKQHFTELNNALNSQNFNGVMEVIMKDSNQFHATCLDTYPPLLYLNDFSRQIIQTVHIYNRTAKKLVGYTFDAGSHAVLLIHNSEFDNFYNFLLNEKIGPADKYKPIQKDHILQTSIGGAPISLI